MKKITLTYIAFAFATCAFAQDVEKTPVGVSIYLGAGAFPYGLNSVGVHSDHYLSENNHNLSSIIGVDYLNPNLICGFFAEASLWQNFRSTEWIPFKPSELDDKVNPKLVQFNTKSSGLNLGVLFGGTVSQDLEIHAKLGVGPTWHTYYIAFDPQIGAREFYNGKTVSLNYQAGIQMRYHLYKQAGITSSVAISQNNPVFTLGIVSRI
jgi:hypothetical protein